MSHKLLPLIQRIETQFTLDAGTVAALKEYGENKDKAVEIFEQIEQIENEETRLKEKAADLKEKKKSCMTALKALRNTANDRGDLVDRAEYLQKFTDALGKFRREHAKAYNVIDPANDERTWKRELEVAGYDDVKLANDFVVEWSKSEAFPSGLAWNLNQVVAAGRDAKNIVVATKPDESESNADMPEAAEVF